MTALLVGHAVLRLCEVEPARFGGQPVAALRVVGEERAQMDVAYAGEVVPQRLPRGKCVRQGRRRGRGHRAHPARLSDALLLTRLASRSFQDLTNASAPSRWRVAASSPTSTPARAKTAGTGSGVRA